MEQLPTHQANQNSMQNLGATAEKTDFGTPGNLHASQSTPTRVSLQLLLCDQCTFTIQARSVCTVLHPKRLPQKVVFIKGAHFPRFLFNFVINGIMEDCLNNAPEFE